MKQTIVDVIVIGAGQSGLSASYFLRQYGINHLVLERGRIGESWRSQRWDSFKLNTANKLNTLPGTDYNGNDPDGFATANEYAQSLETYRKAFDLPVIENARVLSVEKQHDLFTVVVTQNGYTQRYEARQVIVSSGEMSEMKLPAFASALPSGIHQFHAGEYRRADLLPAGAVLVVGSAQSGIQIAEELAIAGKQVFLSTSMVPRVPGSYRGKDIMDWLVLSKFFDVRTEEVTDPMALQMKAPQLTGIGECRRSISLQSLANKGVVILGKLHEVDKTTMTFLSNAAQHIQFADTFSQRVKGMIDEFIQFANLTAPEAEVDEADKPDVNGAAASSITTLDLQEHKIRNIIWCTGFKGDYNYLQLPVIDDNGNPIHQNGVSKEEGLYFLGLHWLRMRKSGIIFGIKDDAEFIVNRVRERHRPW